MLKVCGHIMKRLSSWRRPFFVKKEDMSFVTKLNSWRRKHYKIRLDSFLYSSGFTAKINTMGWDGMGYYVPVIVEKFTTDLVKI